MGRKDGNDDASIRGCHPAGVTIKLSASRRKRAWVARTLWLASTIARRYEGFSHDRIMCDLSCMADTLF
jgi:hypothetical protein